MTGKTAFTVFLCSALVSPWLSFGQSEKASIRVLAYATAHSVKLRWAPDTPGAWHLANQYGYHIERVKLSLNGKSTDPERKILTPVAIRPADEKFWEPFVDTDDYVAVAAQAVFGEDFDIEEPGSGIARMVNKAKILESRFSFALFACDHSMKAAELSGLYFEDETVGAGAKYLYRIYANVPPGIIAIDTGFVYTGLQDHQPLPKPMDLEVEFADRIAHLTWSGALSEKVYNSFVLERSEDGGKSFRRVTRQPVINTTQGKESPRLMYRSDSLAANGIRYMYRIIGVNSFGEQGPPSDTVSGMGRPQFTYSATIQGFEVLPDARVRIKWSYPDAGASVLKGFDLLSFHPSKMTVQEVIGGIAPAEREMTFQHRGLHPYYIMRARDVYGQKNDSHPYLIQAPDSIPPDPPAELMGRIDSAGRVSLKWKMNDEADLFGYSVFRSNHANEFLALPGSIFTEARYEDSVDLGSLSEEVYYRIVAYDNHFNRSDFSEVLRLKKPDVVAPVPPVFSEIAADSAGIHLKWRLSSSSDVMLHRLYRKSHKDSTWIFLKEFDSSADPQLWDDHFVEHRVMYAYTVVAVDDDGLESLPAQPVHGTYLDPDPVLLVDDLKFSIDRKKKQLNLTWKYPSGQSDGFLIYRSNNGQPLKLYRTLDGAIRNFSDTFSMDHVTIEYRVVALLGTGERSRFSEPLIIRL